jgi:DNA uptake protein ComE-like DNA-binding protein
VAFRVQNGPFRTLNELMAVKGIGQATYARLLPHLRIGPTKDDAESDSLR